MAELSDVGEGIRQVSITAAVEISVGRDHACARLSSGGVQCWGNNSAGQLGNNSTANSPSPVTVTGVSTAIEIDAGGSHSCAVLADGSVRCWGANSSGQLGNSSNTDSSVPVIVGGVSDGTVVALGSAHTCILQTIGDVKCFGANSSGQIGDGTTTPKNAPVSVGLFEVVAVTASDLSTCVTRANSEVNCWGLGGSGQMGNGSFTGSQTPVLVSQISSTAAPVANTTPSAPQTLIETSHDASSVSLSWTAPSDNGGDVVSDYQIEYLPSGGSWTVFNDGTSNSTSTTVTGLTRGLGYLFRVTAINAVNTGSVEAISATPFAVTTQIVPAVNPGLVRSLSSPGVTATSVTLVWTTPEDDGGRPISDYAIEYRTINGTWATFSDSVSTATIAVVTSLTQGVSYEFRVSAISANGMGSSVQLSGVGIPATVASNPTIRNSEIVVSGTSVQVSWNAPYDGGRAITDYEIETNTGSGWATLTDGVSTTTSAVVSGLSRGTVLRVRIRAINAIGASNYSYALQETMTQIAPGRHGCSVGTSGSVWCWGLNTSGEVGDGTTSNRYEMMRVPRISNATKVAIGYDFSCALLATSEVMCWGLNATGQLGNGTTTRSVIPQKVSGIATAVDIDTGAGFACAVLSSGGVKCWGSNAYRQLGDGTSVTQSLTPVSVSNLTGVSKIATAGNTACALISADGSVNCWGRNNASQTANGGITTVITPTPVKTSSTVVAVGFISIDSDMGADAFCGVTNVGSVRCWGANNVYQVGTGVTTAYTYATSPSSLSTGVSKVAVGAGHSCALSSGVVRCWGYNVQGASSPVSPGSNVASPTIVVSSGATDVIAGEYVSCSYGSVSNLSCWGWNGTYGLQNPNYGLSGGPYSVDLTRTALITRDIPGQPTNIQTSQATQSSIRLSWSAPTDNGGAEIFDYVIETSMNGGVWSVIDDGISASTSFVHTGLVRGANYLYRVKAINEGDLVGSSAALGVAEYAATVPGVPSALASPSHTATSANLSWTAPTDDGGRAITDYVIEFKADGGTWVLFNDGTSTTTSTTVTGLTKGQSYSFRVSAVNEEGVGFSSTEFLNQVSWGTLSCSVGASGQVWCSGAAQYGPALGNGYERVLVPGITNAIQVSVGADHTCALLSTGTVKCWGFNGWGELGNGTTVSSATPVDVTGLTNVVQIESGYTFACARKADGTVWCWGNGDAGRNGIGTTVTTPTKLTTLGGSATDIATGDTFGCAVVNSYAKCWGYVVDGRLGNPKNLNITTTPQIVRIGTVDSAANYLNTVVEISNAPGSNFTCARKADGTVWCWGSSSNGQSGTATGVSTFAKQIPGLTSAAQLAVASRHACALTTASSVFCWGYNAGGMVGDGSRTDRSTATRVVTSGATWVSAGHLNSAALVNGRLLYWGDNDYGQQSRPISSDTTDDLLVPTDVSSVGIAYAIPATVPAAPEIRSDTHIATSVTLSWSAPSDNGGLPITDYVVQYKLNSSSTWLVFSDGVSASLSATVTGLTRGSLYDFRVAAVNADGTGTFSVTWGVIPSVVPGAVGLFVSPSHTTSSVELSWSAPADDGGRAVLDYKVEYLPSGGSWTIFDDGYSSVASTTVTGLTKGTSYQFRVSARHEDGFGIASSLISVVPATVPTVPVITSDTHVATSVTLSWSAPSDNGGQPITDYAVQYKLNSSSTWTLFSDGVSASLNATVTGLTRGSLYDFRVAGVNADGTGSFSNAWSAIPSVVPVVVTSLASPTHTTTSVDLTWVAPVDDGGQAVTDYKVEYSSTLGSTWTVFTRGVSTVTSTTVTGLTKGTQYQFRVSAKNANGFGTVSSSVSVVPATVPAVPTIASDTHVATSVTLSWSGPSDNGGQPITDYAVQYKLNSSSTWTLFSDGVSASLNATVTGLTRGSLYDFRIAGINVEGSGAFSSTWSAIPSVVPVVVTSLASPSHTTTSVDLTWVAPVDDGGQAVSDYKVEYSINSGSTWTLFDDGVSTITSAAVTGLTKGTLYQFRVSAKNANGFGTISAVVAVTAATVPDAPVITAISAPTVGGSALVVSTPLVKLTTAGGLPVNQYEYRLDGGSWTTAIGVTGTFTISSLVNGQSYAVEIRARNADGYSPASNSINVIPAGVPTTPIVTSVDRPVEGGKLAVNFIAADGNGRALSAYEYSLNGTVWSVRNDGLTTESPLTVTGLVNGTSYTIRVRAVNTQGRSLTSIAMIPVVPGTTASAPTISAIEPNNGGLGVIFTTPSSNGGLAISNYEYSVDGAANWVARSPASTSTSSPWVITGLSNGTSYGVQIRAVNAQGGGTPSGVLNGVPASVPSSPSILSIARPTSGNALVVDFSPPTSDGGRAITKYQYSLDGGQFWQNRTDQTDQLISPIAISGLVNGTVYRVSVRAVSSQGNGGSSETIEVVPAATPSSPTSISTITPSVGGEVDVYFTGADGNGADVTGYEYSINNGITWQGRTDGFTTESPLTIDGLSNGTIYSIRIRAVNIQGRGLASSVLKAVPATVPGRAIIGSLGYGESRITVDLDDVSNGGSDITNFAFSVDGGDTWDETSDASTSFSVGGLKNGETYAVSVRAGNRQGYGPASEISYVTIGDKPEATTTGAADVTSSTVQLKGTVSANFVRTTTEFQLSKSSNLSSVYKTVTGPFVVGDLTTTISADVSDIDESTTFFYRIVARNSLGVTYGSILSFKTNGPLGITANSGAIYTNSPNVQIGISWPRGSTAVILSNDGGFGTSSRFSLTEAISWTLQSSGNERLPKTVYAKFVLADGSRSSTYTDDIILDETAPVFDGLTSGAHDGEGVSVAALRKMLTIRASDSNSGIAKFEIRSSASSPSSYANATTPEAASHSVAVITEATSVEVRVIDRAGNLSGWKPVSFIQVLPSSSPAASPKASPPVIAKAAAKATAVLKGVTASISVSVPSSLAKTCTTTVVKGKKVSTCKAAAIVVSVSGGATKTYSAKSGSNAFKMPAKKGATVTIKVGGKIIKKIKL